MTKDQKLSIGVGALVQNNKGQVLLIERRKQPNLWTLPSGFIEHSETVHEAIHREIKEETGVTVEPRGLVGLRQRFDSREGNNLWVLIRADHVSGEPRADGQEVSNAAFFDITATTTLTITQVTRRVLQALKNNQLKELELQSELTSEKYLFFC